jgi:hypothetical protein
MSATTLHTNEIPDERVPQFRLGVEAGEYLELPGDPEGIEIVDADDGGAWVNMPGERAESIPPDQGFYQNLAARLPQAIRQKIANELIRLIEEDKQSREERDKQYEEGIRRTGLGKDAPGGAQFQGASKVVHPMMTEACIDYESRMIKELFPPAGPVKPRIIGAVTKEKTEKAKRKADHMNWQLTEQIIEARPVLEVALTQVPLGGSQFIYQYWSHRLARARWEFVPIDKVYVPASAADFASADRKTMADSMTAVEYRKRVEDGLYIDLDIGAPGILPDPSRAESASNKVEGVEPSISNLDGNRPYYMTMAYLEVSEEAAPYLSEEQVGNLNPYLITIDQTNRDLMSLYRNWEDGDHAREPIEHLFEIPFLPWRGAFSIGFPQIIGGLSGAATGALRALLDSAHANNMLGGYVLKGSGSGGQNRSPNPGELVEIEGGLEADDIRKRILPNAISPPSPVLFELLGFVTEAAKGVVRTSLDDSPTNQGNTPVPVGTQMSRVEEGLVVFSAVHGRGHWALDRILKGLHRLNRLYLPKELKVDAAGKEILVRRSDYEGPCDIEPVSDPTIYSDQQRFNQLNYIQARAAAVPAAYDLRKVELAGLKLMKWPDPESILILPESPEETNPVVENLNMALGKQAEVFPHQDHLAHIQVHMDFLQQPMLGGNPLIAPAFLPLGLKHIAQHFLHFYASHTLELIRSAAGRHADDLDSNDVEVKAMLDRLMAMASQVAMPQIQAALGGTMQILAGAFQHLQQLQPKPPMDPALAAVQVAQAETQRKAKADQAGAQQDAAELASKNAIAQQGNAIKAEAVQASRDNADLAARTKIATTQMDTATAKEIAEDRAAMGARSTYTDGGSLSGG